MANQEEMMSKVVYLKSKLNNTTSPEKILAVLERLDRVAITINILQETGIGKVINSFRKMHGNVGIASKALVTKWKSAVQKNSASSCDNKASENVTSNGNKVDHRKSAIDAKYKHEKLKKYKKCKDMDAGESKQEEQPGTTAQDWSTNRISLHHSTSEELCSKHGTFEDMLNISTSPKKKIKRLKVDSETPTPNLITANSVPTHKDILDALPDISPDYKPVRSQNVLLSPQKRKSVPKIDETLICRSKRERTQVFSGKRQLIAFVPSLYDSCMNVLIDNRSLLETIGGIPYDIMLPVLEKCNPSDLYRLEDLNPYLLEDSDPLWRNHVMREFKGEFPGECQTWRELYLQKLDEREARLRSITAKVSASMKNALPVPQTKLAVAKAPRHVRRKQIIHGTAPLLKKSSKSNELTGKGAFGSLCSAVQPSPAQQNAKDRIRAMKMAPEAIVPAPRSEVPKKAAAPLMQKTMKMFKGIQRR